MLFFHFGARQRQQYVKHMGPDHLIVRELVGGLRVEPSWAALV